MCRSVNYMYTLSLSLEMNELKIIDIASVDIAIFCYETMSNCSHIFLID